MHFSRRDWGARPAKAGPGGFDASEVLGVALHWPSGSVPKDKAAALRSYQSFHQNGRGWSDIAYNVAFDQDGNTYDLRGLDTRSGANGDTKTNRQYVAFLLLIGPGEKPSAKMIAAVQDWVHSVRVRFPRATAIKGHCDVRPDGTACPGPNTIALIRSGAFEPPAKPKVAKYYRGKPGTRTVRVGSRGDDIKWLKRKLGVKESNGFYGVKLALKVRAWKKSLKQAPSTTVGPWAWKQLLSK